MENFRNMDRWDVIVAGGGPSGCAAAVAAARLGAKTLLVERTGSLGGMATSGLVPAWCPFTDGEKIIYRGIAQYVFEQTKARMPHIPPGRIHGHIALDPQAVKEICDDLMEQNGVTVLFHSFLCAVDSGPDGTVRGVSIANKAGLRRCTANVYVDCTGDGDLAAWAGATFEQGSTGPREVQSSSLCFVITNVNSEAMSHMYGGDAQSPIWEILQSGCFPDIQDNHLCVERIGPRTIGFNAGHLFEIDATDPQQVSDAMARGRKIARQMLNALQKLRPEAFGQAYLAETAALLGVRESRRIMGDYVLTVEDYKARRSFADEICRNAYFLDLHACTRRLAAGFSGSRDFLEYQEAVRRQGGTSYQKGESHGVPYRTLTPKGLKNVLVAGRCISCDRYVQSSVRVMPACFATGEAAGTAAAMAARMEPQDVHAVNVGTLRAVLRENGAYLPE